MFSSTMAKIEIFIYQYFKFSLFWIIQNINKNKERLFVTRHVNTYNGCIRDVGKSEMLIFAS